MLDKARRNPTQEPLDDEERELMDPESWDWNTVEEGLTVGEPGTLLTLEFTRDEHHLLAQVASGEGLTTHEFIKRSALSSARAKLPDFVNGGFSRQARERRSG